MTASLTRTGVLTYTNPDGSARREYRAPDQVFREDSLESLRNAPVTNEHPSDARGNYELVNANNYRRYTVGNVLGSARQDGTHVAADLAIQSADALEAVESGKRQISCGYHCDIDPTPGISPEGEKYDVRQANIVYNHVAIVSRGRAGADVALRLDSSGNQVQGTMTIEIIDGTQYKVSTDAHTSAVQRRDAAEVERRTHIETLTGERDALTTRVNELQARVDGMDAAIAEAVQHRMAALAKAAEMGVSVPSTDSVDDVHRAILQQRAPHLDGLAEASSDYLRSAVEILSQIGDTAVTSRGRVEPTQRADADEVPAFVQSRKNYLSRAYGHSERNQ